MKLTQKQLREIIKEELLNNVPDVVLFDETRKYIQAIRKQMTIFVERNANEMHEEINKSMKEFEEELNQLLEERIHLTLRSL